MIDRLMEAERLIMELRARLASIEQRVAENTQSVGKVWGISYGDGGGGSGAFVYTIAPIVIAPGGNVTGQTVSTILGTLPGTYTVYNIMAVATVATAGKTIIVGANPDGTFTAITQSC
jgi:hypothetical protein